MVSGIANTIKQQWDNTLDIGAFAGMGYLGARAVNWFTKQSSNASFFQNPAQVDLKSAMACCGLFAVVDRVAYTILQYVIGNEANKSVYSTLRLTGSAVASVSLFNVLAERFKLVALEKEPAIAVILVTAILYSQVMSHLSILNSRYQGNLDVRETSYFQNYAV